MAETIRVFACPKCGLIIEKGTNPCPYCKTPIAWEGIEQQPATPQAETSASVTQSDVSQASTQQTPSFRTPIVEVDHTTLNDPAAAYANQSPPLSSHASSKVPSNDQLLAAATSPVLDSIDYASQDTASSSVLSQVSSPQASAPQAAAMALRYEQGVGSVEPEPISLSQQQAAPSLQVESPQQAAAAQAQVRAEASQISHATTQAPAMLFTPTSTPAFTQASIPAPMQTPAPVMDSVPQPETKTVAQADAEFYKTTGVGATGVSENKQNISSAPATASAVAADTAGTTKVAPVPKKTLLASAPPLPDMPPIKQPEADYPPIRKTQRGKGVRAVSLLMKIIAVIVWIVAIAMLIGAREAFILAFDPFSFDALIDVLTNNETVKSAINFVVAGFLFFGVAEIIKLLGDIRRGAR